MGEVIEMFFSYTAGVKSKGNISVVTRTSNELSKCYPRMAKNVLVLVKYKKNQNVKECFAV